MKEIPPNKDKEDVNAISEILKALVKEVGLKTRKVNLTVSGSGVQMKRISVPSLPKAELKEAVRWEMKDHLPFPVETAEIDFHILNEYVENNVKKLVLMVVACPNTSSTGLSPSPRRPDFNRFISMWLLCPLEYSVGLEST